MFNWKWKYDTDEKLDDDFYSPKYASFDWHVTLSNGEIVIVTAIEFSYDKHGFMFYDNDGPGVAYFDRKSVSHIIRGSEVNENDSHTSDKQADQEATGETSSNS